MVVCKFFQQGNCRFGQNCRFDHIYGSKYSYNAVAVTKVQPELSDEQLVNQIQAEVQAVLKGGQWILSVFAPFKDKPSFPGFIDLSPEEARLFIYEAKANNNTDKAVSFINGLKQDSMSKYEQLLRPSPSVISTVRSIHKGYNTASPFHNSAAPPFPPTNAMLGFSNTGGNNTSIFSKQSSGNSVFGNQNAGANGFISENTTAMSIFCQANQNIFNPNPNQESGVNASNIFASASQTFFGAPTNQNIPNNSSPFNNTVFHQTQIQNNNLYPHNVLQGMDSTQSASGSTFGQGMDSTQLTSGSIFGQGMDSTQSTSGSIFGQTNKSSNIFNHRTGNIDAFGQTNPILCTSNAIEDTSHIYSKLEELSQHDIDAFTSERFELGFIPELPPPVSSC